MVSLLTQWRRAERALSRGAGRSPSFEEVAASLGLSEAQKTMVAQAPRRRPAPAGERLGRRGGRAVPRWATDDGRPTSRGGRGRPCVVAAPPGAADDRERLILSWRYGLDGAPPLTLKETGRRLGITREWVREIEVRALGKIGDEEAGSEGRRPPPRAIRRPMREVPIRLGIGTGIEAETSPAPGSAIA